jgi:hypothetical protein
MVGELILEKTNNMWFSIFIVRGLSGSTLDF